MRVDLVTPHLPELAVLLAEPVATSWSDALDQGHRLSAKTGTIVLVKGGHLNGDACPDALVDDRRLPNSHWVSTNSAGTGSAAGTRAVFEVAGDRVRTSNTHGTGCSMSSAIATLQARYDDWPRALTETKAWLTDALRSSGELHVGRGNGPINHFHSLWQRAAASSSQL